MELTPVRVDWPRVDRRCGTVVTSVQQMGRPERWPGTAVYVGMPGKAATAYGITSSGEFGKPWSCLKDPRGWRYAFAAYLKRRLADDPIFRSRVASLHGQTLVCWCKGSKKRGADPDCHGDLLARYAEWLHHDEAACLATLV